MAKKAVFAYDGNFYTLTQRLFDFIMLNILWILFSLPLVTFGASTAAFYYTAVKVLRKDRGHMWDEFWHSFKINLKSGIPLSLLFFVVGWVLQFNIGYSAEISSGDFGIFLMCFYAILSCLTIGIIAYSLASLSRFDMSAGWILKIGIYMTFKYFFSTIAIVGTIICSILLVLFAPFFILVVPAAAAIAISFFMERILKKHTPEPEDVLELEYKWYR